MKEFLNSVKFEPLLDTLRLEKISDEAYFSERFSCYISNSRLSLIDPNNEEGNNPKAFFEGLTKHNKYSTSFSLGTAVHQKVLQSDLFEICWDADRPTAKLGAMADYLYKNYFIKNKEVNKDAILDASDKVDYYKGKMNQEKIDNVYNSCIKYWNDRAKYEKNYFGGKELIFLDPKMRDTAQQCIHALQRNSKIQNLLHPEGLIEDPISENEQAILLDIKATWEGGETILKLKAKLDNYTIDKEMSILTINDVKTLGRIVSDFNINWEKYHYYRELAIYSWLLSLCANKFYGIENPTIKGNCLIVSTIPQYYTKIYEVTKRDFIKGFNEFKYLLKLVCYYINKGYTFE